MSEELFFDDWNTGSDAIAPSDTPVDSGTSYAPGGTEEQAWLGVYQELGGDDVGSFAYAMNIANRTDIFGGSGTDYVETNKEEDSGFLGKFLNGLKDNKEAANLLGNVMKGLFTGAQAKITHDYYKKVLSLREKEHGLNKEKFEYNKVGATTVPGMGLMGQTGFQRQGKYDPSVYPNIMNRGQA